MMTAAGPKVIEFNARLGDPETQPILMRLESDLLPALNAAAAGDLEGMTLEFTPRSAITVVVASAGYPDTPRVGDAIEGLDAAPDTADAIVFHAGTKQEGGRVVTAGGRVLGVTALGDDLREAKDLAYEICGKIHFEGVQFRRDIGYLALPKEQR
jgi:phosphoribosylamine--glycine ligase